MFTNGIHVNLGNGFHVSWISVLIYTLFNRVRVNPNIFKIQDVLFVICTTITDVVARNEIWKMKSQAPSTVQYKEK